VRKRGLMAARSAAAALGDYAAGRIARAFIDRIDLPRDPVIAGYAPLKGEVDPLPLLQQLTAMGCTITLPVAEANKPLSFHRWKPGDPLIPGAYGTREPGHAPLRPNLLIVPLVAFDREGWRLGRGGGFYDRTIAELRAAGPVTTVGIAFAAQRIPQVPRELHDQRLDWIVTEEGAHASLTC
jgi:5-formyltetrahydrofolate cyclo-ligase